MRKSLSFLFVFLVLLLLLSGIAAAGFWQDVTGDIVRSFKTSSYANDLTLASSTRIIQNAEYFLNNYPSLANVKTKITSMGGLAALEEVFASYNPYESISTKERKFNEIFRRYPLINEEDRIYIVHLAHALWIEKNNVVPWSLRDYNADKITALLERGWAIEELANRRFEDTVIQRASSAWEYGNISKDWYKLYPLTMNIINGSGNQLTAASLIIEWAEKNFFDAYGDYGWGRYMEDTGDKEPTGSSGQTCTSCDVKNQIGLEDAFRERIIADQLGAELVAAFLRSVNIPAYEVHTRGAEGSFEYGIAYAPSLELFVHGNLIASFADVPASSLLMSYPRIREQISVSPDFSSYKSHIWDTYPYYSVSLEREGDYLYISHMDSLYRYPDQVDRIKAQLWEYNISLYSSARVKIKTLRELTNPPLEIARGIPTIREKIPIITRLSRMFGR
ncbi:MAG TPA: hypothetical protein HA362_03605 [Nanoarchaeota archaeon]|nr:hypothetical protein [Nanoarchaeota archaeon]